MDSYTTGAAAKVLKVCPATVRKWTVSGVLGSYRLPGGHRRITREEIERFAREYSIPIAPIEKEFAHAGTESQAR